MPAEVLDVTTKFMREPVRILVKKEELTLEGIRQFYINVEKEVQISGRFYAKQATTAEIHELHMNTTEFIKGCFLFLYALILTSGC